jgi:hypothetical protein
MKDLRGFLKPLLRQVRAQKRLIACSIPTPAAPSGWTGATHQGQRIRFLDLQAAGESLTASGVSADDLVRGLLPTP